VTYDGAASLIAIRPAPTLVDPCQA
jgi:hypothetical protein